MCKYLVYVFVECIDHGLICGVFQLLNIIVLKLFVGIALDCSVIFNNNWTIKITKNVRDKWDTFFQKNQTIHLEKSVDNKPLFMHLFDLKGDTPKAETDKIIESFVKK